MQTGSGRSAFGFTLAAVVWSLGLLVAALVVPVYSGQTVTSADGLTLTSATLVQKNGAAVLIPVAAPALACALVWAALRWKCTRTRGSSLAGGIALAAIALLGAFALVAILSIGIFVVPAVVLLALAAKRTPTPAASGTSAPADGGC